MAKKKMTLEEKLEEAIVRDVPYEVPDNWIWVKLGDYIDYATDYVANGSFASLKANVQVYKDENYALMVKTKDFSSNFSKDLTYTDENGYEFLAKSKLFGGELILSNVGSIGKVFRVPYLDKPMTLASNSIMIKCYNELDYDYLYYLLLSPVGYDLLMSITTGTAVMKFNKTGLKLLPIPIPPLKEQQRIVDKIESLFEKLDKAKELIEEARYDFEKRKSAILEKAFRGELTNNWRYKNNISNGWKREKLKNIGKITSGGTPSRKHPEYFEGYIPWIKTGEIIWNRIYDSEEHITQDAIENSSAKLISEGAVLVAMYGQGLTRGRAAILEKKACTNQAVCALIPNDEILNYYLYYYFMSNYWEFRQLAKGGNQENLSGKVIGEFEIEIPSIEEQKEIVRILDKLLEEESKIEELTTLEEQMELIKKSILAKAFRGQLGTNCEEDESALELLKEILSKE